MHIIKVVWKEQAKSAWLLYKRGYTESENSTYVKISCKEKKSGQHEEVPGKEWIQSQGNFLNRGNTATDAFLDPW